MTRTMTLADFLLARIAEDEAETRYVSEDGGWELASYMDSSDDFPPVLTISRARVLAECKAKRRIVAFYLGSLSARQRTTDPIRDALAEAINESHSDALKAIGIAYTSHPDYRDEWKL